MGAEWPFVGRSRQLRAAIETVARGRDVVFTGPPGVGKSRLARELLTERRSRGWTTAWVAGTPSARAVPFGAFAPLLPVLRTNGHAPARESLDVLLLARHAILDRSRGRPYLLAIDDAHLLDEASALLTLQLAPSAGVSLVLTLPEEGVVPEPLTALWKEQLAEHVSLRPLSRAKVTDLLEAVLGAEVDGLFAQQAWKASAGNLVYLRELIQTALDTDQVARVRGTWRLNGHLAAGNRLLGLIEARLAAVPAPTRRALEVVAVGERVNFDTLGRVASLADTEDGERRGLLACESGSGDPAIRLVHPLYAEALLKRMPESRRRSIIHDLADAFAEAGDDIGEELLRYVTWRLEIGESVPAATLLQAARRALEAMDLPLAERLAVSSVAAGAHFRSRIFLAGVHYRQGRGDEALAELDAIKTVDEQQLTEIEVLRVSVLFGLLGRPQDAEKALEDGIQATTDNDCRAWLTAMRAYFQGLGGDSAAAVAISAPLVKDISLSPRPLLAALSALGPGLALNGRTDEAVRVAGRATDPALRAADEWGGSISWSVGTMFLAHLLSGNLDEAEALGRFQYETALGLRNREAHGAGAASLGWVALVRGRMATAIKYLREAEPYLRHADVFGIRAACMGGLAQALALTGDAGGAAEVIREADSSGQPRVRWLDFCVELARAWTLAIEDPPAGAGMCLKAAEAAEDRGQLPFAAIAYHDAVRLGAVEYAVSGLEDVARRTDGPFPREAVNHAEALAAGNRDRLLEAADAFERLGMLLAAAEAVVEAQYMNDRQGDPRLGARAAALVARCEGAMTPGLVDRVNCGDRLTRRELAVARLAIEGHSSKAIACDLAVSVRTIESHLTHAYRKLGVQGRQELASVISPASGASSDD